MFKDSHQPGDERREARKRLSSKNAFLTFSKFSFETFGSVEREDCNRIIEKGEWEREIKGGSFSAEGILRAYDSCEERDDYLRKGMGNRYSSLSNLAEAMRDHFKDTPLTWNYIKGSHFERFWVYSIESSESNAGKVLDKYNVSRSLGVDYRLDSLYTQMGNELLEINKNELDTKRVVVVETVQPKKKLTGIDWMKKKLDDVYGEDKGYLDDFPYGNIESKNYIALRQFDRAIRQFFVLSGIHPDQNGIFGKPEFNLLFNQLVNYRKGTYLSCLLGMAKEFTGDNNVYSDSNAFYGLVCSSLERIWSKNGKPLEYGEVDKNTLDFWKRNPGIVFGDPAFTELKLNSLADSESYVAEFRRIIKLNQKSAVMGTANSEEMLRANLANDFLRKRKNRNYKYKGN